MAEARTERYRQTANIYSSFPVNTRRSGTPEYSEDSPPPVPGRRTVRFTSDDSEPPSPRRHIGLQRKSKDADDFKQYLRSNGINEGTIEKLIEEEIGDLNTLGLLTNDDIENLNLKTGQKAKVRSLQRSAKSNRQTSDSRRHANARSNTGSVSSDGDEPNFIPSSRHTETGFGQHMRKDPKITKNVRGLVMVSRSPPSSDSESDGGGGGMRRDTLKSSIKVAPEGRRDVALSYNLLETGTTGKVVMELSTLHEVDVKSTSARILILVDISGSMGIKYDRRRKHSKLSRMKKFAKELVDSLDDGDFASVVTFGEKTNVLLPLTEINSRTRAELKVILDELDKTYLSTKTNLSAGLSRAIDIFSNTAKGPEDLLKYRNSIIVFSDGEINAGTIKPNMIVHEVREKIRSNAYGLDDSQNQWVTISTIATGNEVSEAMYLLSKCCSSDAFYHLDVQKSNADDSGDLFLPVLLRKTAVVWNVSIVIEASNGATIIDKETTQDNKIRLRGSVKGSDRTEKAFFYYDIPAASSKHIGVALDLSDVDDSAETIILKVKVEYTAASGIRMKYIVEIKRGEFSESSGNDARKSQAIAANMMHDARLISQHALHQAAEHVKSGNVEASTAQIRKGKSELQCLMDKYGAMATEAESCDPKGRHCIVSSADTLMRSVKDMLDETEKVTCNNTYADSIMDTMQSLLEDLESSKGQDRDGSDGKNWAKIKAVSSAITREAPTISDGINYDVLAPLPNIRRISGNMQQQMENMHKKREEKRKTQFRAPIVE